MKNPILFAAVCVSAPLLALGAVALASPPSAVAEGGAGGSGGGTVTVGGTTLGTATGQLTGVENIPGGAPGAPGCITGGCSGSLTTSTSTGILTGPGGTPPPTGLQITPTVNAPQPNAIACITAQCYDGRGSLSTSGGVSTPIVGATGGFNGYIHG